MEAKFLTRNKEGNMTITKKSAGAILVVGGAGYIGSHVCRALSQQGFLPVTLDNLSTGHQELVHWGPLERGDIRDTFFVENVIKKYSPLAVIHLAAHLAVGESVINPSKYYENNVLGSLRLLDMCVKHQIDKFIFSSTAAVYGCSECELIDESHPTNPINPYGSSKLMVEKILKDYEKAYGLRYIALRYFNAAGADPDLEIGCIQNTATNLIPILMQLQAGSRASIEVFGHDYPTRDATAMRDYIHVTDLANAHVKAVQYLEKNGSSHIMNLGTGHGHTVLEVIHAVEQETKKPVNYRFGDRRQGDPTSLIAKSDLAQKTLEWTPIYSDLKTIVATAWAFHQKQFSRDL